MGMVMGREVHVQSPFRRSRDRGQTYRSRKRGFRWSLLTDEAGIPLALVVDGANCHNVKLLCATEDGLLIAR